MAPRNATLAAALSTSLVLAALASPAAAAATPAPAPLSAPTTPVESDTAAPDPEAVEAALPEGVDNADAAVNEVSGESSGNAVVHLDLDPNDPAVVSATWTAGDPKLEYRAEVDGQWSEWLELPTDDSGATDEALTEEEMATAATASEPLALVDATAVEARPSNPDFTEAVELKAYSSAVTAVDREVTEVATINGQEIATPLSTSVEGSVLSRVVRRSSWGAATPTCTLDKSARKYATIVHHTAGTNSYTRDQVPAILRGIQASHINKTPTWCDVGYHMLVDKWGTIYEGAAGGLGESLVAAHAGGWNSDTFGVSVLGDYTQTTPSDAVQWSLKQVAGWQAAYWGYDPTGSITLTSGGGRYPSGTRVTINRVLGHKDVGYTECPGSLYNYLGSIRTGAKNWAAQEPIRATGVTAARIAGDNRYTTAVAASRAAYPSGARTVYVATGANYADALVAAPAAAKEKAPLLLTKPGSLPTEVAAELTRLDPYRIIVVGGTGAVSEAVVTQLKKYATHVGRRGGANRYETAARVNRGAFPSASRAYIATGLDYPDALAASALAGSYGAIVMLVPGKAATANQETLSTLNALGVSKAVVVGGPAVVSNGIASSLAKYSPTRVYGADRYETARRLNASLVKTSTNAYLATGRNFPDALSAAAIAGAKRAPLYLAPGSCVPLAVRSDIVNGSVTTATMVGGTGVLAAAVGRLFPC